MSDTLTIALPEGVAEAEARWRVNSLLRDMALEARIRATVDAAIESDDGLAAFAASLLNRPAVDRASVYGGRLSHFQEIVRTATSDPRRPVLMRGGRSVREARAGGLRPWLSRVATRWMRMAKITAFDHREFCDATAPLRSMLAQRVDGRRCPSMQWPRTGEVLVNGEWVYLKPGALNRLRALHAVREKAGKLERRAAAMEISV